MKDPGKLTWQAEKSTRIEDVFPIEHGDFPASHVIQFTKGYLESHLPPFPVGARSASKNICKVTKDFDITLTVETHNFPCGIAPFPGEGTQKLVRSRGP